MTWELICKMSSITALSTLGVMTIVVIILTAPDIK